MHISWDILYIFWYIQLFIKYDLRCFTYAKLMSVWAFATICGLISRHGHIKHMISYNLDDKFICTHVLYKEYNAVSNNIARRAISPEKTTFFLKVLHYICTYRRVSTGIKSFDLLMTLGLSNFQITSSSAFSLIKTIASWSKFTEICSWRPAWQ